VSTIFSGISVFIKNSIALVKERKRRRKGRRKDEKKKSKVEGTMVVTWQHVSAMNVLVP